MLTVSATMEIEDCEIWVGRSLRALQGVLKDPVSCETQSLNFAVDIFMTVVQ